MVRREVLAVLKANEKEAKSPKPEMPRPPKLVCMCFRSTSTCINVLSQFYFLTPMDYSPRSEREIWPNLKSTNISETEKAMPTKIGLHAFHINLYLHEFFEPILFDSFFFHYHGLYLAKFEKEQYLQNWSGPPSFVHMYTMT